MKKAVDTIILLLSVCFLISIPEPVSPNELICGIATGYPPYQFQKNGIVTGFDADVARLVLNRMNMKFRFMQDKWDDIVALLRLGEIDLIVGMEINESRKPFFEFSKEYYIRHDVVFIRADNKDIKHIRDLYDQFITGDRHSFVEILWEKQGIKQKIRIIQTASKEESMKLLYEGRTKAAIMPEAVGYYLAKQIGLHVRILDSPDPGSPVAIAVKKKNTDLIGILDKTLHELIAEGEIDRLYKKWFIQ
ncbi:transporter substrate-binding domain-containing protein [Desulforegula conservatrix]|uniref:transporter substrate-binding domain-containing protein n=1 Tax=Desulforegula conservatrix TaxID=153026 RepID=UPI000427D220|nr:transporter substrate-binding domain-containing protein [Desulforegula conservatrix]